MAVLTTYNCTALTGGATRALDSYHVAALTDGDRAQVALSTNKMLYFKFSAAATDAEDTANHPYKVRPDDYSSAGVWIEQEADVAAASATKSGIVELATDAETITGTDTVRAVTPANITAKMDTDGTLAGNSDTRIPSQKAVKTYADTKMAADNTCENIIDDLINVDTDGTLAGNSDYAVPTQAAAKTYADTKVPASYLDTDGTLTANSDVKIATQKATKTYADTKCAKSSNLSDVVAATALANLGGIAHSLATAANDFLVASGVGTFVKKTLAETLTILGKAAASGLASLDGSSKVVQDPANATATPTASKIVIADGSGKVDGWVSAATDSVSGKVELATTTEATTGTDTTRAVTPAGNLAARQDERTLDVENAVEDLVYLPPVTFTWDPGSLGDGVGETSAAIAYGGLVLGQFAIDCVAPYDLQGITLNAWVSATDTAKARLQNETGGTIDLASGTWTMLARRI